MREWKRRLAEFTGLCRAVDLDTRDLVHVLGSDDVQTAHIRAF